MPNKYKWKPGDKVKLASGGPEMTVKIQGYPRVGAPNEVVICQWFDKDAKLQEGEFAPESLNPSN